MKKVISIGELGIVLSLLFGCSSSATETQVNSTPTKGASVTAAPTIILQDTQEPAEFLLSEPGPFLAGNREYTLIDNSRNSREIKLLIWYPALKQIDTDGSSIIRDAEPDTSNAPYPVILTEENTGRYENVV